MGRLTLVVLLVSLWPTLLNGFTTTTENSVTVYLTDGSLADVQAACNAASDGQIVDIPLGTFEWIDGVHVSGKGITVRGQGGGAILGFSYDLEDFTPGSKTFTFHNPDPLAFYREPVVGETLEFHYPVRGADDSLVGEVTAWDPGTDTVTVNITTVNGAGGKRDGTDQGDEAYWVVVRPALTSLVVAAGSSFDELISMHQDDDTRGFIEDIGFDTLSQDENFVEVWEGGASYQPVTMRRCMFSRRYNGISVEWRTNKGLIYDCSWHVAFNSDGGSSSAQGLRVRDEDNEWVVPSRLGTLDTDGLSKLYVEDSIMHGHRDTFLDSESNSRTCIRNSVVHTCAFGGHSMDTGFGNGMREFEFYNNAYLCRRVGSGRDFNFDNYVGGRGGTGIAHSSYVENNQTSSWNATNKFITPRMYNLTRGGGEIPGPYSYGDGETVYPSVDYPVPQGPGVGYIDGSNGTFEGATGTRQVGEPVPIWVWNLWGDPGIAVLGGYGTFIDGSAYNTISSSEWSNDGGDLLLTETGTGTYLPTVGGARVRFDNGTGTLPTGLSEGVSYYAIEVSIPGKQWKFSATPGGSAIPYTDSGTSTNYLSAADSTAAHFITDTDGDSIAEGDLVFHHANVPLPGYEAYPYPHWLQTGEEPPPSMVRRIGLDGVGRPTKLDSTGGQPFIFDNP